MSIVEPLSQAQCQVLPENGLHSCRISQGQVVRMPALVRIQGHSCQTSFVYYDTVDQVTCLSIGDVHMSISLVGSFVLRKCSLASNHL